MEDQIDIFLFFEDIFKLDKPKLSHVYIFYYKRKNYLII